MKVNLVKILFLCSIWLGANLDLSSQQLTTPVAVHLPIILKSLEYDRNIRKKSSLKIAIIYQEHYRSSLNTKNQVTHYLKANNIKTISNTEISIIEINLDDLSKIKTTLQENKIDFAYVAPLRAVNIDELSNILILEEVLAFSGVADYIQKRIPFTVDLIGERPKIVVDLNNSRRSGADFSVSLLKLAKVINSNGK